MENYKKVFVLGAGFSKAISNKMPTLSELCDDLLNEKDEKYKELNNYFNNITTLSNEKLRDFEKLCHLILSKPFYYSKEEEIYYDLLRNQLMKWIYDVIDKRSPVVDSDKEEVVLKFIEYASNSLNKEDDRNIIVTFNYDLLIERIIKKNKNKYIIHDYSIKLNSYEDSHIIRGAIINKIFEYIKLHGSFNWFLAPSSKTIDLDNVYDVDKDDNSLELIHSEDYPVYIPMSYSKTKYLQGTLFNILWNKAITFFKNADEINFIGYSFPTSDVDNLNLFLKFKDKIKDIVVFDKNSEDRIKELFEKSNIKNMDAFEYLKNEEYR